MESKLWNGFSKKSVKNMYSQLLFFLIIVKSHLEEFNSIVMMNCWYEPIFI